jgi:hypothetical protein
MQAGSARVWRIGNFPFEFAAGEYQIQTVGIGEEKWRISRSWKSKL